MFCTKKKGLVSKLGGWAKALIIINIIIIIQDLYKTDSLHSALQGRWHSYNTNHDNMVRRALLMRALNQQERGK